MFIFACQIPKISSDMKLKTLFLQLLKSPRNFPVEAALGIVFFLIAFFHTDRHVFNDIAEGMLNIVSDDILLLFVPLVILAFWLQRVNRWLYYASFFLIIPLLAVNLKPFLLTYGFAFTYVLAAILLVVGNKKMENRTFAGHALHVVTQMFFGLLITGIFNIAVLVIFKSFCYIFGLNDPWKAYAYIYEFIWFILAPQVCCTLIRQNEDEVIEPAKVLQHILNFILSPAVIIYAVILYVYFIKIAIEWDLPKGGIAWMVMGFITVALTGRMLQTILSQRYYDWFYRYFTLIAIPPLIMFWVGSIYRIRLYNFTEGRFYLMLAGVLMTLYVLMLLKKHTHTYQFMALIFGATVIIFTYIPGISAKSIGLSCQKQRLSGIIQELNLADLKTGKLTDSINATIYNQDSLMCEKYKDACRVIHYVQDEMGRDTFKKQYGEWKFSVGDFYCWNMDSVAVEKRFNYYKRTKPVELGEYNVMLLKKGYDCVLKNDTIYIRKDYEQIVVEYPVNAFIQQDTVYKKHPELLLTYHNDSIMLVLESIDMCDGLVFNVDNDDFMLFKKNNSQ